MQNCKDCKHWKRHGQKTVWGDCLQHSDPIRLGVVDFEVECRCEAIEKVTMQTHPDFGCVLWEEKK